MNKPNEVSSVFFFCPAPVLNRWAPAAHSRRVGAAALSLYATERFMTEQQPAPDIQLSHLLGRFWTAANMLSLFRMALVPPVAYLIITDGPLVWVFALIVLAVMTDWFDGRVARWSHTVSEWGKVLDPLADKVAAVVVVLALVIRGSLPVWFLSVIAVRDVLIVIGGIVLAKKTGRVLMSAWLGKAAVTVLSITVLAALLRADHPVLEFCIWATTVLMVAAFVQYCTRFMRLMRQGRPPDSGLAESAPERSGAAEVGTKL